MTSDDGAEVAPATARSTAGNAASVVLGELVSKGAGFVLVIVLARNLRAFQYGWFIFAISFVPLFLQFARWGLDLVTVRELAADPRRLSSVFVNGFAIRLVLAGTAAGLACLLTPLFVDAHTGVLAVSIVAFALFLDELTEFIGSVFVAFERMRLNALTLVTNRVVSTSLAVIAVGAGGEIVAAAIGFALGSLAGLAVAARLLRSGFPPVRRADFARSRARSLLRKGAPYGFSALLNMGVFRIDAVMLQALVGAVAVGMYGVAYRFFEPLLFATWALGGLVLPRLVRAHASNRTDDTFTLAFAVQLAIYLPVAIGAPFCARSLIVHLFSPRYAPATPAVLWLTSAVAFYAIAHLARTALVAQGLRSGLVWAAGFVLAFNVALNLVLIPRFSFTGAAAATCATEVLEAFVLMGMYLGTGGRLELGRAHLVPVVAVGVMGGVLLATGVRDLPALAVGVVVYAVALVVAARLLAPGLLSGLRSALRPPNDASADDESTDNEAVG